VLSFVFLAVCLVNTVGLLLAKFLKGASASGIRRVLGATQRDIVVQHLIETSVLASAGAMLGLALGALGLWGVRVLYANNAGERGGYEHLAQFEPVSIMWVVLLALVATLIAGLYPAWRVGRLEPAGHLKSA
jgi:putative ABC transport system permease protein